MKNELHYINIPVKEIDFMRFYSLIGEFALVKGNIGKSEIQSFKELFDIMENVLKELNQDRQ